MDSDRAKNNAFSIMMSSASKGKGSASKEKTQKSPSLKKGRNNNSNSTIKRSPSGLNKKSKPTPRKINYNTIRNENETTTKSKFVSCPICNVNVIESKINVHLDKCTTSSDEKQPTSLNHRKRSTCEINEGGNESSEKNGSVDNETNKSNETNETNETIKKRAKMLPTDQKESSDDTGSEHIENINTEISSSKPDSKIDALSHMMHHARRFCHKYKPKSYSFHLHNDDGHVSWVCNDDIADNKKKEKEKWISTVFIKGAKDGEKDELIISSSISSSVGEDSPYSDGNNITINRLKQLVLKPSKLSVPVLKSCLQKAVRRKRPLPAVRCAMELIDKSFSDFIRRFPVIILEDSSLHPDFPLLIWLMIASSKDFIPSSALVMKMMRIVFEVASCSWKDDLVDGTYNDQEGDSKPNFDISLDSAESSLGDKETLILRSIILRKQYGGMACDMKMLDGYIFRWHQRFQQQRIDKETASRCFKETVVNWIEVPYLLHKYAIDQSQKYVSPLILGNTPLIALKMNDVSASGIDFHCSNVLDFILRNDKVYSDLSHKLSSSSENSSLCRGKDGMVTKESLAKLLKECMWNFSSGVNVRRSLVGTKKEVMSKLPLYQFWSLDVEPHIKSFVHLYIHGRLSKC